MIPDSLVEALPSDIRVEDIRKWLRIGASLDSFMGETFLLDVGGRLVVFYREGFFDTFQRADPVGPVELSATGYETVAWIPGEGGKRHKLRVGYGEAEDLKSFLEGLAAGGTVGEVGLAEGTLPDRPKAVGADPVERQGPAVSAVVSSKVGVDAVARRGSEAEPAGASTPPAVTQDFLSSRPGTHPKQSRDASSSPGAFRGAEPDPSTIIGAETPESRAGVTISVVREAGTRASTLGSVGDRSAGAGGPAAAVRRFVLWVFALALLSSVLEFLFF